MRTYRDPTGHFPEQPFFNDREFESITAEALDGVGLLPKAPEAVRIERFIEKRFDVVPEYEELPPGTLGMTVFGERGVVGILISRDLEDGTIASERRVRTTMAHEAGHGILHAHLFALANGTRPLFGDFSQSDAPRSMCRDDQIDDGPSGGRTAYTWHEFQANRAMSCLLMPARLVAVAVEPFLEKKGALAGGELPPGNLEGGARHLADVFDVNPVVARIRLRQLFKAPDGQRRL